MSERLTILVCSTCGGKLKGRTCINGHNAYPSREVEVVPVSRVVRAMERYRNNETHDREFLAELDAALHPAKENEGLYPCPTCGENVTRYGQRCERCTASLEHDRLERESGR